MKRAMFYRGHYGVVEFDPAGPTLIGKLAGIKDIVPFQADVPTAVLREFRKAVDDYIRTCEAAGKKPDKAHSGKLTIRVDPTLHAEIVRAAEIAGMSLNTWGEAVLRRAAAEIHDDATPV